MTSSRIPIEVAELLEFLDGANDSQYFYWAPSYLGKGGEGMVFVSERHSQHRKQNPSVRFDYVTIKVPKANKHERLEKEHNRRVLLTDLPFVTPRPSLETLSNTRTGRLLEHKCLITPLKLDSSGGPAPISLAKLISMKTYTHRELSNWISLARSLAQALWSVHALNFAHGDVKPDNIVLRSSYGLWYDILLIDFGLLASDSIHFEGLHGSMATPEYCNPAITMRESNIGYFPSQNDIYALGVTLAEVLRGKRHVLDAPAGPDDQTPQIKETALIGNKLINEINDEIRKSSESRTDYVRIEALKMVRDHLLECRVGDDQKISITALQDFLARLENLRTTTAIRAMHYPSRDPFPTTSLGALAPQLASLRRFGNDQEITTLCETYVKGGDEPDASVSYEHARSLLREGKGRLARRYFRRLLSEKRARLKDDEIISSLRLCVGVLCLRDRDFKMAHELLKLFQSHRSDRVEWWAKMLHMRLLFHEQRDCPEVEDFINEREPGWVRNDDKAAIWMSALRIHRYLYYYSHTSKTHSSNQLLKDCIGELEDALNERIISSHEECYLAILLARAYSLSPTQRPRSPDAFLSAVGKAHFCRLPHEHAAALAVAAKVTCRVFARQSGKALHRMGMDPDECLFWASECAAAAAEMYHLLDVSNMSKRASVVSAECLRLCEAPEYKILGIRNLSYAQNRYMLNGEQDIAIYQDQIQKNIVSWQRDAARFLGLTRAEDPGSFLARGYYNRYGGFGTGMDDMLGVDDRVSTEAISQLFLWAEKQIPGLPKPPGRLLDWGCGSGRDAIFLANKYGYDVMGVDSSAWAISRANSEIARTSQGKISFAMSDLARNEWQPPSGWPLFDIITCRDVLHRIARRTELMGRLSDLLANEGVILIADLIQAQACSAGDYAELCGILEIPGLGTLSQYTSLFQSAKWRCKSADATDRLIQLLKRRQEQLRSSKVRGLWAERTSEMLEFILYMLNSRKLGWVFVAACKASDSDQSSS